MNGKIACRDIEKGAEAVKDINKVVNKPNLVVKHLNLASFTSIKNFAQDILENEPFIHILINNAGVAACPKSSTDDGFEMQFGVNHLGHFLLTNLLLDRLKVSAPARIVNVSSLAHMICSGINFNDINMDRNYRPIKAYGTGVTTYCLHPGAVHTGLGRHLGSSVGSFVGRLYEATSKRFFKSALMGAQTTIHCSVEERLAFESGLLLLVCMPA
ncbi:hypothetical protein CEXT_560041 [Caerostris extrusa]|uniref:Uncharacterized protein n=1 Tax=Caerostris extrusa TaxID=172846 RepID=A0AAV4XQ50_CAEEX|nr:hypothetical protein CEXT_560041 [Caerostris extrusa]